jgi:nitrogen fixation protein
VKTENFKHLKYYFLIIFVSCGLIIHVPKQAQALDPILMRGIQLLAKDPQMIGRFLEIMGTMPNVKMKTMGGKVFWSNLYSYGGWRLQCNKIFGNCRIINPQNIRVAWGGATAMRNAFTTMMRYAPQGAYVPQPQYRQYPQPQYRQYPQQGSSALSLLDPILRKGIHMLAEDPQIVGRFLEIMGAMPNIRMKTMGGRIFWSNIYIYNGWRLQCNKVFRNCRILNPRNIRIAWGGATAMRNAFQALIQQRHVQEETPLQRSRRRRQQFRKKHFNRRYNY